MEVSLTAKFTLSPVYKALLVDFVIVGTAGLVPVVTVKGAEVSVMEQSVDVTVYLPVVVVV